jgi:hypothetical protein
MNLIKIHDLYCSSSITGVRKDALGGACDMYVGKREMHVEFR